MKRLIAIAVLFLIGCESYSGLYIDDSCTEREIELIEVAVERLNTAVGEEVVYVAGVVNGGEDDTVGQGEASRDVVFCDASPTIGGKPMLGKVSDDDIYMDRFDDDTDWLWTIMHELGHLYMGAHHILDEKSIMYRCSNGVTDYTEADLEAFGY